MTPQEIEATLGIQLKEVEKNNLQLINIPRNSYFLNDSQQIIGLNLSKNQLTESQLSFIQELSYLIFLNLSENKLTQLQFSRNLANLQFLNLSENKDLSEITFETGLPNLEELNISECSFHQLKLPAGFIALRILYVQQNKLKNLEIEGNCPNLEFLDASSNQLTSIHFSNDLPKLERLYLHEGNKLENIDSLKNAINLKTLNLASNLVRDITALKTLLIGGVSFSLEETGSGVLLKDCPLTTPPPEIVKKGNPAIQNYFKELDREGSEQIREVKMLILGEGGAGKTSLVVRLREGMKAELPGVTDSTKGIDIYDYQFITSEGYDFKVNIWDFGGQEIYHATHQFFLTKRSLYVLVTDVRKEDTDFNYWLQLIELLSDNSPVLVFQNQKGGRKKEINEKGLRGLFGNIKDFQHFDLKYDTQKLHDFKKAVEFYAQSLPHVNEVLPKVWVEIRKEINKIKQKGDFYISDFQYLDLCAKYGLDDDRALFLSQFLHDLGVFLHFQEDPILKRWVFINNEWVTEGVYAVLDNDGVIDRKGRFNKKQAAEIWTGKYNRMHDELLQLMTKFELCYRIPDIIKEEFIAPQLLPANEPKLDWDYNNNLQLRYHYRFMPKGILSRLIVRLHRYIIDVKTEAWKTGVVLHREGAIARVAETYDERNIFIHVKGVNARDLLTIVAEEIDRLNHSYHNLKVEKLVPCNCESCDALIEPNFYEYADLTRRKELGRKTVECKVSYKDVEVLRLLDNVFVSPSSRQKPIKLFISYSRHDVKHLKSLKKQLSLLQRQNVLLTWDDTKLQPGEEWDDQIKNELKTADLVLLLVSPDLLATNYIWEVEMKVALERHKLGEAMVIPIIVRPCVWDNAPFAKFQALPVKGKPVTKWDNEDEAWEKVTRSLKELTEKLNDNNSY